MTFLEERRRSHDRRKTEAGRIVDELRALDPDVEKILAAMLADEKAARAFIAARGGRMTPDLLAELLNVRALYAAPTVFRELARLSTLDSDPRGLRRVGDSIGRRPLSGEVVAPGKPLLDGARRTQ